VETVHIAEDVNLNTAAGFQRLRQEERELAKCFKAPESRQGRAATFTSV
jgi:hypothetical protein